MDNPHYSLNIYTIYYELSHSAIVDIYIGESKDNSHYSLYVY